MRKLATERRKEEQELIKNADMKCSSRTTCRTIEKLNNHKKEHTEESSVTVNSSKS